jgi:hypothetical protein
MPKMPLASSDSVSSALQHGCEESPQDPNSLHLDIFHLNAPSARVLMLLMLSMLLMLRSPLRGVRISFNRSCQCQVQVRGFPVIVVSVAGRQHPCRPRHRPCRLLDMTYVGGTLWGRWPRWMKFCSLWWIRHIPGVGHCTCVVCVVCVVRVVCACSAAFIGRGILIIRTGNTSLSILPVTYVVYVFAYAPRGLACPLRRAMGFGRWAFEACPVPGGGGW